MFRFAPPANFTRRSLSLSALLLALLLVLAGCNRSESAPESAAPATESVDAGEDSAIPTAVVVAATEESFSGLPVGFTEEGWPFRGNPAAPLTMYEFSDFQCPFCARYFVQTEPAINETWVQDGRLRVIYRDMPLTGLHPNAVAAHEAALCVGEQGAALYWEMHNKLFESQPEWSNLADPQTVFSRLVSELGNGTGSDAAAWQACVDSDRTLASVETSLTDAIELGFDGTPSFQFVSAEGLEYSIVGAQPFATFETTIESMLAGSQPTEEEPQAPDAQIPYWATSEGLAVDPDRPGYTVAGDATRGSPDAPVIVIEFTDLQCPYCSRHNSETQPVLDAQFVETGQVRWVLKHFPLRTHQQAPAAAVAAECAGEQGRFWEMSNLLFASMTDWSISDPSPVFTQIAANLALDTEAFAACLLDPAMLDRVETDAADGANYVQGTPTFILRYGNQGRIIPGALPTATFIQELTEAIEAMM